MSAGISPRKVIGRVRGRLIVIDRSLPNQYEAVVRSLGAATVAVRAAPASPLDPLRVFTPTSATPTTKGN
ncbi:hypothetical protein LQK89_17855 (plasmid) [Curtobacterium sp. C1]|uniref:hypothetical protein n=1 Tax=Curtobacterium sp. C1 TaxID=2898151 RepID=UPI001E5302C1|nr:hypothetical protein [Curtobacterium sp. C1]UFU16088.1 hypothetical protein LQK89_17855 [Curtobacterium sp. C1]